VIGFPVACGATWRFHHESSDQSGRFTGDLPTGVQPELVMPRWFFGRLSVNRNTVSKFSMRFFGQKRSSQRCYVVDAA
jgi:hypothetical protein